jgi:hypothetical protein
VADSVLDISSLLTFLSGQIFYSNPIIFFFIILSTIAAFKNDLPVLSSQKRLLLYCSLPLILIATGISLFKNVLPHWTGPAYSGLILLTACYFSKQKLKTNFEKRIMPRQLLTASSFQLLVIAAGILLINFMPGTLGKKDNLILGEGDFTLDMYGWRKFEKAVKRTIQTDLRSGIMRKDAVIISNKWFPASHVDYYVAMPMQKDLLAIGDTNDIHQYAWINNKRKKLHPGDDAYCIVPSNYYFDPKELYAPFFSIILPPQIIEQRRGGKICRYFYIWRLKNFTAETKPPYTMNEGLFY